MAEEHNEGVPPHQSAGRDWRAWLEQFRQPGLPQIGWMVGSAAALALLVALVLWWNAPSYTRLYTGLSDADTGKIMETLQQNNIPFKVDARTGTLKVPADQVHAVRFQLASQGLPKGAVNGFESLDQQSSFGVSQFMESARYQHALEGELVRSIMSIGAVQNARVHLAIPKDSVFVRYRQPPTASVLVQLYPGRILDAGQVAAIVHLVSSSVPKLSPDQVTVIDQAGNLLTRSEGSSDSALRLDRIEYTQRLEEHYVKRIEDLLTPLLGMGRVRAQVALEIDFAATEETAEHFDPKQPPGMLRSEQLLEEGSRRQPPVGIPGALSNQPPGVATVPQQMTPGQDPLAQTQNTIPLNQRRQVTRNYELDKRTSHIRQVPGRVQRITTAVVLDDRLSWDAAGKPVHTSLTSEELEQITGLVKEAVGFNTTRGDSVSVMNATFAASPFAEPPLPLWQQDWLLELVKWGVIGGIALLTLLLVVRPLVRRLLTAPELPPGVKPKELLSESVSDGEIVKMHPEELEGLEEDQVQLSSKPDSPRLASPAKQMDERLKMAKALVAEDPKRSVQVIKNWLANGG